MNLDEVRAFVKVAEHQSFSVAAETLHITQPAVSKRIAALEQAFGVRLFDRVGRTLLITEAGQALLVNAQQILQAVADTQRTLANLDEDVSGTLTIGISHHIGLHRLPPVLRTFIAAYPKVALDIQFLDSEQGCAGVEQGRLELAIITLPEETSDQLEQMEIWQDPLAVVAPVNHPLVMIDKPDTRQLSWYEAILPAQNTFTRRIVERHCQLHDVQLQIALQTNYLETIKMLVSIGLGWSVLPKTMLQTHADDPVERLDISDMQLSRSLGMVTHRQRTLSHAASALITLLEQHSAAI